jgi:hypothetical protein
MENPRYINIRNLDKGVQIKEEGEYKKGSNSHCIIEF